MAVSGAFGIDLAMNSQPLALTLSANPPPLFAHIFIYYICELCTHTHLRITQELDAKLEEDVHITDHITFMRLRVPH